MARFLPLIHSHWQHTFEMQFSSSDFYDKVEVTVQKLNIPDIKIKRITLAESKLMLSTREYLRITRKGYSFDICAAPFGNIFFVSYWYGEQANEFREMIGKIPLIGPFINKVSELKTYYQVDSQNMFGGSVRSSIMQVIDDISKAKGIRGLSEFERTPEKGR